jgi:uncharacterized protein YndB with AHSA1/START domain
MNKTAQSNFVYVTYIRATPERVWSALTDSQFMKEYWFGVHFRTEWKAGAPWQMIYSDGRVTDTGEIVEFDPPKRMVLKWRNEFRPELKAEGYGQCEIEVEPVAGAVKLTITHSIDQPQSKLIEAVSGGWPKIMSNLKSLLETGELVLQDK